MSFFLMHFLIVFFQSYVHRWRSFYVTNRMPINRWSWTNCPNLFGVPSDLARFREVVFHNVENILFYKLISRSFSEACVHFNIFFQERELISEINHFYSSLKMNVLLGNEALLLVCLEQLYLLSSSIVLPTECCVVTHTSNVKILSLKLLVT